MRGLWGSPPRATRALLLALALAAVAAQAPTAG